MHSTEYQPMSTISLSILMSGYKGPIVKASVERKACLKEK